MERRANTDLNGNNFTMSIIEQVWQKGSILFEQSGMFWRKDIYGSIILYDKYGDTNSKFGWEIDHIDPNAKVGKDDLSNLQPLQWENIRKKSDDFPRECKMNSRSCSISII